MEKRYWLETYGCQMNKAESNALESSLVQKGWKNAESPEQADLVILNTCSVRKTAESRIWGRLGYFRNLKKRSHPKIAVMGCMAERLKDEFRREAPEIDILVGTSQKGDFFRLIDQMDDLQIPESGFTFQETYGKETDFQAYIPIMHGCDNFCSYCIVPYVRGREISRNPEAIIKEVEELDAHGVKEITLLGQNVNSYWFASGSEELDFPSLLKKISERVRNIRWIPNLASQGCFR